MRTTISRDVYARCDTVRETVAKGQECAWCGQPAYHVLFHELGHSTGHATRLDRDGITECAAYGSPVYSREELLAELTAANLSAHAGIDSPSLGENQAAYVAGWISRLKEDSKAVVWAAGKAARAADFILGKHRNAEESDTANEGGQA